MNIFFTKLIRIFLKHVKFLSFFIQIFHPLIFTFIMIRKFSEINQSSREIIKLPQSISSVLLTNNIIHESNSFSWLKIAVKFFLQFYLAEDVQYSPSKSIIIIINQLKQLRPHFNHVMSCNKNVLKIISHFSRRGKFSSI